MRKHIVKLTLLTAPILLVVIVTSLAAKGKEAQPSKTDTTIVKPEKAPPAPAEPATGEQIKWQVVSAGGRTGDPVNADTILGGSVGQTAAGTGIVPTCCNTDGIRGDVDFNGAINVADLGYKVDYLFFGGPPPPCPSEADDDANGSINVADLTYEVDYLFFNGPPPAPCPAYKYRLDHGFWQSF